MEELRDFGSINEEMRLKEKKRKNYSLKSKILKSVGGVGLGVSLGCLTFNCMEDNFEMVYRKAPAVVRYLGAKEEYEELTSEGNSVFAYDGGIQEWQRKLAKVRYKINQLEQHSDVEDFLKEKEIKKKRNCFAGSIGIPSALFFLLGLFYDRKFGKVDGEIQELREKKRDFSNSFVSEYLDE